MNLQFRDLAKPGASLAEVLQGLARALVEDIEKLPDQSAVRIHDIRVSTKKIQALLRLSGRFVKPADQAAARALTRSIRGAFAGERDEEVLRLRLRELLPGDHATAAIQELSAPPPVQAVTPEEALVQARHLETMLAGFDLAALRPRDLVRHATASYRKARKIMRACRKKPEDDPMHTWRKRVKDVSYHALFLAALDRMKKRTQPLDNLADCLGEYHDLAVLFTRLGPVSEHSAVVGKRKRTVGKIAFKQGAKLFALRPSRFAKKLDRVLLRHVAKSH